MTTGTPIAGRAPSAVRHRVTLLPVGRAEVPGPEVFWMRDFDRWYELCFQVAVIRGPSGTVLVNTGPADDLGPMNAGWEAFLGARAAMRREPGELILTQLEACRVDPAEVTQVVLTPLQLYTISNVLRFPNAEICISRRGWENFHTGRAALHDTRHTSIPDEILIPLVTSERHRLRLLDDEELLVPGVRTWWSGAHHRASVVVEVDTAAGTVALSDSFFLLENVDQNHPIGICESIEEAFVAQERVRATADIILPLYDPKNFDRYPGGEVG